MRTTLIITLCVALSLDAERPPNIVFILADDLGITDINAYARHFTDTKQDDFFTKPLTSTN